METTPELKSSLIHIVLGAFIGFISSFIQNSLTALLLAIVVLFATGRATEKFLRLEELTSEEKKYGKKWWLTNGVYPYMIFWLFVWIIFYNI